MGQVRGLRGQSRRLHTQALFEHSVRQKQCRGGFPPSSHHSVFWTSLSVRYLPLRAEQSLLERLGRVSRESQISLTPELRLLRHHGADGNGTVGGSSPCQNSSLWKPVFRQGFCRSRCAAHITAGSRLSQALRKTAWQWIPGTSGSL